MNPQARDSVLMVGFHFPPCALSSGHLRLLAFAKHLPECGWNPVVLSARGCAYEKTDATSIGAIPPGTPVHRAFALDARRHLGFHGKYPSILAQPDRWISWWPAAVLSGLRLIRRHRIRVIWSTYPIMTAHCVAYTLSRVTGLPWVADFRDPVASSVAGKNQMTRATQLRWEQRIISTAACSVFTTPGARRACVARYPTESREKLIAEIPNGFDEDDFEGLPGTEAPGKHATLHFVHAGALYPGGRNPIPFFEALANLKRAGVLIGSDIHVTLRASGAEAQYATALKRLGLDDMVTLAPFMPYKDALAEQIRADGLLLFQGPEYDHQIPAKLYEYIRLSRPVFALVGAQGDTAEVLRAIPHAAIAPLNDAGMIESGLVKFIDDLRGGAFDNGRGPDADAYSRRRTAARLAELLGSVSGTGEAKIGKQDENA